MQKIWYTLVKMRRLIRRENETSSTIIFPYPVEQITSQVTAQVEERDRIAKIIKFCEQPHNLIEIMNFLRLRHRMYFLKKILTPLLEQGYLKRTIPDKPRSRFQKYVMIKGD